MNHEDYKNYRFPGQRGNETIKLIVRKHWIVDLKIAAAFSTFLLIPPILGSIVGFFTWDGTLSDNFLTFLFFFDLYFLTVVLVTYTQWLNDELDIIIVTNTRIISHEQVDLFHRQISEAHLEQIQDVTGIQKGMFQSLLDYGIIEVQTSSSDMFFIIRNAERPYEIARNLLDLRDQAIKSSS
jgi:hypothetical protein